LGHIFAERLGAAKGPVHIAVPTRGLSIPNVPGGVFWDEQSDRAFLETLRRELDSRVPIDTFEYHVNDPAFGVQVADLFVQLVKQANPWPQKTERPAR
jgi:uncharacterized protein (UPF0261 family)